MRLWRFYLRALLRQPVYVLTWLLALLGAVLLPWAQVTPPAEAEIYLVIAFFLFGYLLAFLVDPRKMLSVSPFFLALPRMRERMALLLWGALGVPLLFLLWPVYGLSSFWLLHAVSLLELSLLTLGSAWGWGGILLPVLALCLPCAGTRWPAFLLLALPYLVSGGLWLGRRLPSGQWRGFRYTPRYALPVAILLLAFDLYQRSTRTSMRFHIGSFFGLEMPDFGNLFLLMLFLLGGVLFILLPFLNVFGLRQAEESLILLRRLTGTPWRRRICGLMIALLVNIPIALVMVNLRFVQIPSALVWHFVVTASCVHILFLTSDRSDWTGYALGGYLAWTHLISQFERWWLWDVALVGLSLLAYDLDLWLPPVVRKVRGWLWRTPAGAR